MRTAGAGGALGSRQYLKVSACEDHRCRGSTVHPGRRELASRGGSHRVDRPLLIVSAVVTECRASNGDPGVHSAAGVEGLSFVLAQPAPNPIGFADGQGVGATGLDNRTVGADAFGTGIPVSTARSSLAFGVKEQFRGQASAGSLDLPVPMICERAWQPGDFGHCYSLRRKGSWAATPAGGATPTLGTRWPQWGKA